MIALASCTLNPIDEGPASSGDFDKVTIRAHNFVWGETPVTKTSLTVNETDGAVFAWAAGDIVGIYPDVGTQVRFPIVEGIGQDTQEARFTGGGWAVKGAHKYMAYYPFIPDMDLDKEAVPVDYTGQVQNGNNTTAHLSPFDFMAAAASSPSDGEISFDFKHLSSLLMLNLVVPKVGEYTTLTLSCPGAPFVTKGTVNITADTPEITPTDWSNEFVIYLSNFSTTQANESVVIYALIPPVDMSEQTITVNLRGDHADCETSFTRGKNKPFLAGRSYRPTMGVMVGGDIIKLESGHQFNEDIKSLVNGEHFIYDKTDYRIKSISFEVGDDEVPSEYDRVDVSAPDSPSPIYAYWKPESGELVVRTPSNKLFANQNANGMFYKLNQLSSIDVSGLDLSYTGSIAQLFAGCASLTNLDLSSLNTQGIEWFNDLFRGCKSLVSLNISSFNVEDAMSFDGMFSECESLPALDLSHFKTSSKLCWLSNMFDNCKALSSIVFSQDFNTEAVGFFYYMFSGCSNLESIDISMFDTSNGSRFDGMFQGCSELQKIIGTVAVSNKALVLDNMFAGCTSLETLDVSSWDVSNVSEMRGTFNACWALTALDVSNWHVGNVTTFENTFYDCKNLQTLDVSHWNTSSVETFGGMFNRCAALGTLDVSNFVTNNATYFGSMFRGCSSLESIDVRNFNTSNATDLSNMFNGCSSLEVLDLSNFNTSSVTFLSGLFSGCSTLESIDLSGFDVSHVIDMGYLFYQCTNLKTIAFGSFDTHYCEVFERMFSESGIEELDLSFFNTSSATNLMGMFYGCPYLETLNVSSFDSSHCDEIWGFIGDCPILTEIHFGQGFTSGLNDAFAWGLARDRETCSIYCTTDFKNQWLSVMGADNILWFSCDTGEPLE